MGTARSRSGNLQCRTHPLSAWPFPRLTIPQWSEPLGLPSTLAFNDLFSLDPEFLQFTQQPVFAVLLLFPSRGKLAEARKKEQEDGKGEFKDTSDEGKRIWWIKQTVSLGFSFLFAKD